jgi:hypothetical protein
MWCILDVTFAPLSFRVTELPRPLRFVSVAFPLSTTTEKYSGMLVGVCFRLTYVPDVRFTSLPKRKAWDSSCPGEILTLIPGQNLASILPKSYCNFLKLQPLTEQKRSFISPLAVDDISKITLIAREKTSDCRTATPSLDIAIFIKDCMLGEAVNRRVRCTER